MEIISPPALERVMDLDIGFLSGEVKTFTLTSQDSYTETVERLLIQTAEPMEVIEVYTKSLAWISRRWRDVELPPTPPTASEPPPFTAEGKVL